MRVRSHFGSCVQIAFWSLVPRLQSPAVYHTVYKSSVVKCLGVESGYKARVYDDKADGLFVIFPRATGFPSVGDRPCLFLNTLSVSA